MADYGIWMPVIKQLLQVDALRAADYLAQEVRDVFSYEHFMFCHALLHFEERGSLIKYSCWVTEQFNVVWRRMLENHTTHGGGRVKGDGSRAHMNPNLQAFYRLVLLYGGQLQDCLLDLGLSIALRQVPCQPCTWLQR